MTWQIRLENKVRDYLEGYTACHDFWHMYRVRDNALKIAKEIPCDLEVLEAAALLHDVGYKDHHDDENHHIYSMELAKKWLPEVSFTESKQQNVIEAIRLHDDYHNGKDAEQTDNVEVMVLQDADKIEALGAIGVTRLTYYFGEMGYPIYKDTPTPEVETVWLNHSLIDQIQRDPMHKWDLLNFDYSREISKDRKDFLETFYNKLKEELLDHHGEKNES